MGEGEVRGELFLRQIAVVLGLHRTAVIGLCVSTLLDERRTDAWKSSRDIDRDGRIGIGAGGIVDDDVRLVRARMERDRS